MVNKTSKNSFFNPLFILIEDSIISLIGSNVKHVISRRLD